MSLCFGQKQSFYTSTVYFKSFLTKNSFKKVMEHLLCEPTAGGEWNVCGMDYMLNLSFLVTKPFSLA